MRFVCECKSVYGYMYENISENVCVGIRGKPIARNFKSATNIFNIMVYQNYRR